VAGDVGGKVSCINVDDRVLNALILYKLAELSCDVGGILVMIEVDLFLEKGGFLRRLYFALKVKDQHVSFWKHLLYLLPR